MYIIAREIVALSRIYILHRNYIIQILIGVEIVSVSNLSMSIAIIYTQH